MGNGTRVVASPVRSSTSPSPPGWEQRDGLANKPTVLALQDGRILEIHGTRAYLFHAQPAPDGIYHLKQSGQLVVRRALTALRHC